MTQQLEETIDHLPGRRFIPIICKRSTDRFAVSQLSTATFCYVWLQENVLFDIYSNWLKYAPLGESSECLPFEWVLNLNDEARINNLINSQKTGNVEVLEILENLFQKDDKADLISLKEVFSLMREVLEMSIV